MFRSSHCPHTLLPDLKVTDIVLRNSGTSFNLPHCSYKLYKQSFVNRCLFCDCYWYVLFCGTYMLFDLIWCIIFIHIIGWRLSVSINDMLCYVMLCTGHEFVTKLSKRHVEVIHHSSVIDTVHNALETRTVMQCLPTHFVQVIIRIISRSHAAVFFSKLYAS